MTRVERSVGQRRSRSIDRGATNRKFRKFKLMVEFVRGFTQHGYRGPSYFRADAVSREQCNGLFHAKPRSRKIVILRAAVRKTAANSPTEAGPALTLPESSSRGRCRF